MGLGIGGIVSIGGTGTGGTGSASGITEINGQTGPIISIIGVNGAVVSVPISNTILIDVASLSGLITPSGGIGGINGQIGPHINIEGVNGITVSVSNVNNILIDAASISGTISKFAASFSSITSGTFNHGLNSTDVIVQILDDQTPPRVMIPDEIIIENSNLVSVFFNRPQTGKIIIV